MERNMGSLKREKKRIFMMIDEDLAFFSLLGKILHLLVTD
jgi:hypothetical protein